VEVLKSGTLNKPLTPQEAEKLKRSEFADVAATATREVVRIMGAGKKIVPPPPPTMVADNAREKPAAPRESEKAPKEKYSKGSVSALLAEPRRHRASA
jgi:hypothetical protein